MCHQLWLVSDIAEKLYLSNHVINREYGLGGQKKKKKKETEEYVPQYLKQRDLK